jgi:hypothetical protein
VINTFGCSANAMVTLSVVDVRSTNNKIYVCSKNGHTMSVKKSSVNSYLQKGGYLGRCTDENGSNVVTAVDVDLSGVTHQPILSMYPNPVVSSISVIFSIESGKELSVDLYDLNGVKLQNLHSGSVKAFKEYAFDVDRNKIPSGMYVLRVAGNKINANYKVMISR